ncbi:branched-chain amino acid ABC transporter permease [Natribacillus halophilus]|uniref:Amino acid/amide ABC transporter membrane protein 1, HAAT family n=1 Tax=Natribacillus halophilus TaxID=549003 RepID=A0A1G8KGD2_9BACI|nr:branched-chain amino acid ABC transporter permease [Natribacillus halophilus]SDI42481.1 amino acid/amide ABC transporter membrane protein 1, HAAT family [Natribacillus halophilus]
MWMTVIDGITMAALLFIIAVGLNLSFALLRVANLAHGALYLFGAYVGYSVMSYTESWLLAIVVGGLATALLALLLEFFLLRKVRGDNLRETLVTLSVAIILADVMIVIWGGSPMSIPYPDLLQGPLIMGDVIVPKLSLFILGFAIVIGTLLWMLLNKTKIGMIIRAGVDDYEMVAALGTNIRLVFTSMFVLAGFLAGIVGVVGGSHLIVSPEEDWRILTYALLIIILGGMGSFGGSVVAALIMGMIYSFGSLYVPEFQLFLMFTPVALVLIFKPKGLFGRGLE